MQGLYSVQQGHWAQLLAPVDETGGKTSVAFSMKNYHHASIFIGIGVSAAAPGLLTLESCTSSAGAGNVAMAFNVYKAETAGVDLLGAKVAVPSTGFTPSANDGIFYVIELDAQELPDGSPWVRIVEANASNSVLNTIAVFLSGARFGADQSATVLS